MRNIGVVLVLACAACVSTNAALLDSSLRLTPLPCPEAVRVFTDSSKVGNLAAGLLVRLRCGTSSWRLSRNSRICSRMQCWRGWPQLLPNQRLT